MFVTNSKKLIKTKKFKKEMENNGLLLELWCFFRIRKKWWLAPIIIMLIFVGALIIFGQSSALSPFIYALF